MKRLLFIALTAVATASFGEPAQSVEDAPAAAEISVQAVVIREMASMTIEPVKIPDMASVTLEPVNIPDIASVTIEPVDMAGLEAILGKPQP